MNIAILGGTFNPIHKGHLQMARHALRKKMDRVFFIPCGTPPHKEKSPLVSGKHRMAMVRAAIQGESKFRALDLEVKRKGKSYSVDTLRELRAQKPKNRFFLVVGSDIFENIGAWRNLRQLSRLCEWLVIQRPGCPIKFPSPAPPGKTFEFLRIHFLRGKTDPISSSEIRERLAQGQKIKSMLPPAVCRYIQKHQLYQVKTNPH